MSEKERQSGEQARDERAEQQEPMLPTVNPEAVKSAPQPSLHPAVYIA